MGISTVKCWRRLLIIFIDLWYSQMLESFVDLGLNILAFSGLIILKANLAHKFPNSKIYFRLKFLAKKSNFTKIL
jgi:hypothetical protein